MFILVASLHLFSLLFRLDTLILVWFWTLNRQDLDLFSQLCLINTCFILLLLLLLLFFFFFFFLMKNKNMKISYLILLFLDFRYVVYCLDQKQQIYSYMIIFCWWFCVVIFTAMVMGCNFHGHGYTDDFLLHFLLSAQTEKSCTSR